ncbi:hypothetical protein Tco_0589032, partial [Tanacetum coccineum]
MCRGIIMSVQGYLYCLHPFITPLPSIQSSVIHLKGMSTIIQGITSSGINGCISLLTLRQIQRKAAHMLKYPDAKVINLGLDDTIEPIPEVLNQDIRIECAYHNEQTTDPRGIKGMKLHEQTMASRGSIDDDYK